MATEPLSRHHKNERDVLIGDEVFQWHDLNERRAYLIHRNVDQTITPPEAEELARLQIITDERIRQLAPSPPVPTLAEMKAAFYRETGESPDP